MLFHAEDLIRDAQTGRQLKSTERQHCVAYLMTHQADLTNNELAAMFGVSEKQIRQDLQKIRRDKARRLKEDDLKLVIADIVINFERQVKDIEKSKTKAKPGSRDFLEHCKAIFNLEAQKVKLLQDLGFYPKDLGKMTVAKFEFQASIDSTTGAIVSHMVGDEDGDIIDIQPELALLQPADDEEHDGFNI